MSWLFMPYEGNAFEWEYTEQPHASRRIQIMRKHPEVKRYMFANGDPSRVLPAIIVATLYVCSAFIGSLFYKPMHFAWSILVCGILCSWLLALIHEAAHGLVFGPLHPVKNKILGLIISLVVGFPVFSIFKRHHLDHHKYHGDHEYDIEYPKQFELSLFNRNAVTKFIWLQMNGILVQAKTFFGPRKPNWVEIVNISSVAALDIYILFFTNRPLYVGAQSLGIFIASGLGIFGVWGTMVHTLFFNYEDTLSYHGWMNSFFMNIGYHMEHHDFPNVPARYLPEIRRIAPEFYKDNHYLDSFYSPVIKFVHDPTTGLHSRLKRVLPSLHGSEQKKRPSNTSSTCSDPTTPTD